MSEHFNDITRRLNGPYRQLEIRAPGRTLLMQEEDGAVRIRAEGAFTDLDFTITAGYFAESAQWLASGAAAQPEEKP